MKYKRQSLLTTLMKNEQIFLQTIIVWGSLIFILILWLNATSRIYLDEMSDYGLVSELPLSYYFALGLLCLSFSYWFSRKSISLALLIGHVLLLILFIHGTIAVVYEVPRYPWVYKHFGVVNYIQLHGKIDSGIDVYHNWPGFFALAALIQSLTQLSFLSISNWIQPVFNLIYLAPLFFLTKTLTGSVRVAVLCLWFFYLSNWVGQDYFAPQGLVFFYYLAALAIAVSIFRSQDSTLRSLPQNLIRRLQLSEDLGAAAATPLPIKRLVAVSLLLLLVFAISSSHQLTPFALITCILALFVTGLFKKAYFMLLTLGITTSWIVFMTQDFLVPRLPALLAAFGNLGENVDQSVSLRIVGSPEHLVVVYVQMSLSMILWILAAFGVFRKVRVKQVPIHTLALAFAPIILIVLQSYGGELVLRLYFLTQPFICILAAQGLSRSESIPAAQSAGLDPVRHFLAVAALSFTMAFLLVFAYFGNEAIHYVSPEEVEAVELLYTLDSDEWSNLVSLTADFPFKLSARYPDFNHLELVGTYGLTQAEQWQGNDLSQNNIAQMLDSMLSLLRQQGSLYVVLSQSQLRRLSIHYPLESNVWDTLIRYFDEHGYGRIFEKGDVVIYEAQP